jgi:hypothetical protein
VAQHDHRQLVQPDLEHRQVGFRVGADDLGRRAAAVGQHHLDLVGASTTWLLVRM